MSAFAQREREGRPGPHKRNGAALAVILCACSLLYCQPAGNAPYRVTGLALRLSRSADAAAMTGAAVARVVDGDTIVVDIADPPAGLGREEKVRLIGVDTPEMDDERDAMRDFARAARDYAEERLLGRRVLLAFDRDLRDVYGRLLAYVYLEDGSCFDLELVREGYAFAYVKYPFFFMDEFRNAQLAARYAGKGLWGR